MTTPQQEALTAMKALLPALDASPQPPLTNVYVYPDDYDTMDYTTFPFAIVSQVINQPYEWRRDTHDGLTDHAWEMEILFLLSLGPLTKLEQAAVVETRQTPWVRGLAELLLGNTTLNGKVYHIGNRRNGQLFSYRIGHIEFDKVFWGIRAVTNIEQVETFAVSR